MAEVINLGIKGLARDSNPLADAQAGGMRICHNLMLRAPNQAEMRPGFRNTLGEGTLWEPPFAPVSYPVWLAKYENGSEDFFYTCSTNGSAWDIRGSDNTQILGPDGTTPAPFDADIAYYKHFESRKNLYFITNYGLMKSQVTTQTEFDIPIQAPHLPPTMALRTMAGSGVTSIPILDGMAVSYKAVIRRKDANGYVIRSAPSPAFVVENTSGAGCAWAFYTISNIIARLLLNNTHRVGDALEIYRTKMVANGTSPGDEHFFAFEYTLTTDDIAVGIAQGNSTGGYITDQTAEASLGVSLYTNSSQGSATGANYPPPAAVDATIFQGCAWYANLRFPQAVSFDLVDNVWSAYPDPATISFGAGVISITVNNGPGTFPRIGQVIDATGLSPGTQINAVIGTGATVTVGLSLPTLAATVGASPIYRDTIEVAGLLMAAQTSTGATPPFQQTSYGYLLTVGQSYPALGFYYGSAILEPSTARIIRAAAGAINRHFGINRSLFAYPLISVETQRATLIVTRSDPSKASFPVNASSSESFVPNVGTQLIVSSQDEVTNALAYSKVDQPESVPIDNSILVGGAHKAIKRIVTTGTALIVFKEDGIFRVTGSPPDGWRVDLINPTAHLGFSECVTELDAKVYAWTDDGIVAIDQGGTVTNVSDGRISDITYAAAAFTQLEVVRRGHWSAQHQTLGCVLFMLNLPSTTESSVAWDQFGYYTSSAESQVQRQWCYAYWPSTDTWTTWEWRGDPVYSAMFTKASPSGNSLFIGKQNALWAQRGGLREGASAYDNFYTGLIASAVTPVGDSSTVTLSTLGTWRPQTGDQLLADGVYYRVLSLSGNNVTVYDPSHTFVAPDASVGAVEGIQILAEWLPFVPGVPTISGRWREIQYHLGYLNSVDFETYNAEASVSTGDWLATDAIETNEAYGLVNASRNHSLRYIVSRNCQRASRIYPVLRLRNALIFFTLNGISMIYEDVSERQARGRSTANGGLL